jgi:predicted DNA-binding antitoxin AbrB/MazE fold protein
MLEPFSNTSEEADTQGDVSMVKTIYAIYENGVLKPLEQLDLKESQRLKLSLEILPSVVDDTQALIRARPDVVEEVAEGDEYCVDVGDTQSLIR